MTFSAFSSGPQITGIGDWKEIKKATHTILTLENEDAFLLFHVIQMWFLVVWLYSTKTRKLGWFRDRKEKFEAQLLIKKVWGSASHQKWWNIIHVVLFSPLRHRISGNLVFRTFFNNYFATLWQWHFPGVLVVQTIWWLSSTCIASVYERDNIMNAINLSTCSIQKKI